MEMEYDLHNDPMLRLEIDDDYRTGATALKSPKNRLIKPNLQPIPIN